MLGNDISTLKMLEKFWIHVSHTSNLKPQHGDKILEFKVDFLLNWSINALKHQKDTIEKCGHFQLVNIQDYLVSQSLISQEVLVTSTEGKTCKLGFIIKKIKNKKNNA